MVRRDTVISKETFTYEALEMFRVDVENTIKQKFAYGGFQLVEIQDDPNTLTKTFVGKKSGNHVNYTWRDFSKVVVSDEKFCKYMLCEHWMLSPHCAQCFNCPARVHMAKLLGFAGAQVL